MHQFAGPRGDPRHDERWYQYCETGRLQYPDYCDDRRGYRSPRASTRRRLLSAKGSGRPDTENDRWSIRGRAQDWEYHATSRPCVRKHFAELSRAALASSPKPDENWLANIRRALPPTDGAKTTKSAEVPQPLLSAQKTRALLDRISYDPDDQQGRKKQKLAPRRAKPFHLLPPLVVAATENPLAPPAAARDVPNRFRASLVANKEKSTLCNKRAQNPAPDPWGIRRHHGQRKSKLENAVETDATGSKEAEGLARWTAEEEDVKMQAAENVDEDVEMQAAENVDEDVEMQVAEQRSSFGSPQRRGPGSTSGCVRSSSERRRRGAPGRSRDDHQRMSSVPPGERAGADNVSSSSLDIALSVVQGPAPEPVGECYLDPLQIEAALPLQTADCGAALANEREGAQGTAASVVVRDDTAFARRHQSKPGPGRISSDASAAAAPVLESSKKSFAAGLGDKGRREDRLLFTPPSKNFLHDSSLLLGHGLLDHGWDEDGGGEMVKIATGSACAANKEERRILEFSVPDHEELKKEKATESLDSIAGLMDEDEDDTSKKQETHSCVRVRSAKPFWYCKPTAQEYRVLCKKISELGIARTKGSMKNMSMEAKQAVLRHSQTLGDRMKAWVNAKDKDGHGKQRQVNDMRAKIKDLGALKNHCSALIAKQKAREEEAEELQLLDDK